MHVTYISRRKKNYHTRMTLQIKMSNASSSHKVL